LRLKCPKVIRKEGNSLLKEKSQKEGGMTLKKGGRSCKGGEKRTLIRPTEKDSNKGEGFGRGGKGGPEKRQSG